jgi:RNA polymerase sigma factor (sigma-70 family)
MNYTLDELSAREKQVLMLITQGNTNKQIGDALEITESTVETHRKHIKKKLNARHTTDLFKIVQLNNLL